MVSSSLLANAEFNCVYGILLKASLFGARICEGLSVLNLSQLEFCEGSTYSNTRV